MSNNSRRSEQAPNTSNTAAEKASESKDAPADDGLHNYTVRLSDETQKRLEDAAASWRKQTGSRESASGLARTFIETGLAQFESRGGLVIVQ